MPSGTIVNVSLICPILGVPGGDIVVPSPLFQEVLYRIIPLARRKNNSNQILRAFDLLFVVLNDMVESFLVKLSTVSSVSSSTRLEKSKPSRTRAIHRPKWLSNASLEEFHNKILLC